MLMRILQSLIHSSTLRLWSLVQERTLKHARTLRDSGNILDYEPHRTLLRRTHEVAAMAANCHHRCGLSPEHEVALKPLMLVLVAMTTGMNKLGTVQLCPLRGVIARE